MHTSMTTSIFIKIDFHYQAKYYVGTARDAHFVILSSKNALVLYNLQSPFYQRHLSIVWLENLKCRLHEEGKMHVNMKRQQLLSPTM